MKNKKIFLFTALFLCAAFLFSQTLPSKILGIWEAKDRYVFFEQNDEYEPQLVIVLKEYYGWYYDRAAEPQSYSEKEARSRNIATPRSAEHVYIQNINTKETATSLYGSLDLVYSKWQKNTIPFCMINDSIYLSYFEKDIPPETSEEVTWTFYRGIAPSKGFMLSPQALPKDITGLIIDGEKFYDVRYWQTDMDYSTDYITFTYKDDSYEIPKHLTSCGQVYSCVSGRSKKVRNTIHSFEYKASDFIYNDELSVFVRNSEPYLKKLAGRDTFEALMQMVKEANARRKPDPPPLFPESDLDWHWDLIDMLEKDNKLIQEVRARQEAFGPRGKDSGK